VKRLQVAVKRVGLTLLIGVFLVTAKGEAGILDASWTAPTEHTDGSPLTDLASYRLYYGTSDSPCAGSTFVDVASPTPSPLPGETMSVQLAGLMASTRYFVAVSAVDTAGSESACSTAANAVARDDVAGEVQSSPITEQAMSSSAPPSSSASLSATPASTPAGGSITATWDNNLAPTPTDWIGLYAEGGAGGSYLAWTYASCSRVAGAATASGSCPFRLPWRLQPGRYELRLYAANQFIRLATSNSFTVDSPSSTILSTASAAAPGGVVEVSWDGIAWPRPTDWIGLFAEGTGSGAYFAWIYVSCSQWSGPGKASGSCAFEIPQDQPPGRYELRLYRANRFQRLLATSNPLMVSP
jgi:hypothetical protein